MGTMKFVSLPGRKPDVTAEGVELEFVGALAFVDTIRRLLPADGFSDPPAITVTPEGIQAGFSLGIPTVGVGVFSLQNLSLSAALSLPFVGKPAGLRFALSSREHPFLVTVTLFGGGGFFALGVSAAGVEEIEASIEFGGNISLNLGVASGGVYVMAGVYFKMSDEQGHRAHRLLPVRRLPVGPRPDQRLAGVLPGLHLPRQGWRPQRDLGPGQPHRLGQGAVLQRQREAVGREAVRRTGR